MSVAASTRFVIRRRLGEGGMGVVYEAFDSERRAPVAMKVLARADDDARTRFKREFRALQGIAHPNLVALDELFCDEDQWFFTMELLEGVDFVSHVRGAPSPIAFASTVRAVAGKMTAPDSVRSGAGASAHVDVVKLRDGLRQLLLGLAALHGADKVHRDIKPSNVLVTREGRVVLLDFGLVYDVSPANQSDEAIVVGTPAYMAPEQAASRIVGPAADLYSLGVLLYETLTGRLPFEGFHLHVLMEKQHREPEPPAAVAPGVPGNLNALCVRLLRFDPAQRPTVQQALESLSVMRLSIPAPHRSSSDLQPFVGRASELSQLRQAFEQTRQQELSTVLVHGESGIGKSAMVRRFTNHLLAEHPEAMILEGRCYERETVPYKTLDAVVDALSSRLARMSPEDVEASLPERAGTLAKVFPVMLRVPRIAQQDAEAAPAVEAHDLRQEAFATLREVFKRVAARRPTVIVIDDLQWADDDGLRALTEILRPPGAPPLLLIGTVRIAPAAQGRPSHERALERLHGAIPGDVRTLHLSNLNPQEARELTGALLRDADIPAGDRETIAREAGGHPLFVEELARHVALGGSARDDVKLDDAIWARVGQLEPATREMAELAAIAGKPIPQEIVAAAARVERAEFHRRAAVLRVANLVRTGGTRWADAIEPYHDRVREAVVTQLDAERRRSLHEALARAFEASSHADPETLATHWLEAGNPSRAVKHALLAGDQAARTYAFNRAAQWYAQALELLPSDHAQHRDLRVKLGDALASAGRGALAAPHFEAAAASSPLVEALELRRRAADQLLRSGHFDRGMEASRAVLSTIGIRVPTTRLGTVLSLLYCRVRLTLRGLRFRPRERGQLTAEELTRIDICLSMGIVLGFVDTFVGFLFTTRALLFALASGNHDRITRSVGMETGYRGTAGGRSWRATERLIEYAHDLASRAQSVQARWYAIGGAGHAYYFNGRFREAAKQLTRALDLLQDGSTGLVYERVTSRVFMIQTLAFLGRFRDLRRLQEEGLREAVARGDVYGAVNFRLGSSNLSWLVDDQPDLASSQALAAMRDWSKQGFHLEHYYGLLAQAQILLYEGEAKRAYAVASDLVEQTRRSLLWRVQTLRVRAVYMGAASALALLEAREGDGKEALRCAARLLRILDAQDMDWVRPFAAVVRSGIALHRGTREEAITELDRAARAFGGADMHGYEAAARHRLASLRGDGKTAADRDESEAYFQSEGVVAPERMIRMLVPGLLAAGRGA